MSISGLVCFIRIICVVLAVVDVFVKWLLLGLSGMEYDASTIASMKIYVVQMESGGLNVSVVDETVIGDLGSGRQGRDGCVDACICT